MREKVLLIAPQFYSYEMEIKEELEKKGFQVDYVPLYEKKFIINFFIKCLNKIHKNFGAKYYNFYFKKILERKRNKYRKILVINGETLTKKILSYLSKEYLLEKGELILYIWTPIARYPQIKETLTLYSKVFSFEYEECQKYNLKFLPNFYSNKIKRINVLEEYDIFFIGQYRKERYKLKMELERLGLKTNIKLYHDKFYYYLFKILKWKEYRHINPQNLIFKPLTREEVNYYMNKSKCILDIVDLNQLGLTQRIFDCLYLNKKIITTNEKIKMYDFYNENNIYILKKEEKIEEEKLKKFFELKKIKVRTRNKYGLENWLNTLLEER